MCVTFCDCLVFREFRHNLYITFAKYLEEEGIEGLLFSSSFYTVFSSTEVVPWDESSRLLYDISDMFFIAPYLTNLSIFHSSKDHSKMVPNKSQSQYP